MSEPACTGTKRCSKCGETKHVLAFSAGPGKDGLNWWCRECERVHHNRAKPGREVSGGVLPGRRKCWGWLGAPPRFEDYGG